MSNLECLSPGKDVDFQLDIDGEKLIYAGRVCDISNKGLSIEINDERLRKKQIIKGMTARLFGWQKKRKISLPVRIENTETPPLLYVTEDDSRSHFRVDGFVKLKYRKISGEEYARIREQYLSEITPENDILPSESGLYSSPADETNRGAIPANFVNQISLLNRKLYFLKELMTNPEKVDLFEQNPVKVSISGSGIMFYSGDSLHAGDLLDMKMVLPSDAFSIIKTLALIVRLDKLSKKESSPEKGLNFIAAKFVAINEDDRESIIRYVSTWQRKNLRRKRMTH